MGKKLASLFKEDDGAETTNPPGVDGWKRKPPFPDVNIDKMEEQNVSGFDKSSAFVRGFEKKAHG